MVSDETKRVSGHMDTGEVLSATPLLETVRMLCSLMMSIRRPTQAHDREVDISRAHLNCPMRRQVYVSPPSEHPEGNPHSKMRGTW